ncbi:MAG: hypothetical protein DMG43_11775 [Acidobacteria bacterium]|nr:MAG: hypothetical protein DMG43_11775 [Acidobacteriota bacterium]
MHGDSVVGSTELLEDVVLGYSVHFPSAIEMFEPLPGESGLGLITEDKVALCHRRVLPEIPRLADLEVSAELVDTSDPAE